MSFEFKGKAQTAVVSQVENISIYRLYNKIGEVPDSDLKVISEGLVDLIIKNTP